MTGTRRSVGSVAGRHAWSGTRRRNGMRCRAVEVRSSAIADPEDRRSIEADLDALESAAVRYLQGHHVGHTADDAQDDAHQQDPNATLVRRVIRRTAVDARNTTADALTTVRPTRPTFW